MIQLKDKFACCGCSACATACPKQCISMREDEEGFLYPSIDKSVCIDCGLCEKVCPVIHQSEARRPQKVYAAINPDEAIRLQSSSGGIFSMLARQIIEEGGVVFGAKFNERWEVVHDYCDTLEGLAVFRGSKYVQSAMGTCYRQVHSFLQEGRNVLFSGTPCQVAGLHRYLHKDYDNLLTVDIVCHGVPSPLVWRKYVEALQSRPKGVAGKNTVLSSSLNSIPVITGIEFRNKLNGWKKYGFVVRGHADGQEACKNTVLKSGTEQSILIQESHGENLFMRGFLHDIYLRPSCYACPAKSGKSHSDITLADYWGIEHQHPEMDDDKGTSLVLLNTEKGEHSFHPLNYNSMVSTYEKAFSFNRAIEYAVKKPGYRKFYVRKLKSNADIVSLINSTLVLAEKGPSFTEKLLFRLRKLKNQI